MRRGWRRRGRGAEARRSRRGAPRAAGAFARIRASAMPEVGASSPDMRPSDHPSRTRRTASTRIAAAAACVALAGSALADWNALGGNPGKSGLAPGVGPATPDLRWQGGRPSIIAWHPVIEGDRMFVVRQTGFVPNGVPNEAPVVCQDVTSGQELWVANVPYNGGDWTTVVFGVRNGRVYAGRSGNGSSVNAKLHCLDAATGATLWTSAQVIGTGAYDGIAFTEDGDPVVATNQYLRRISAVDGSTVWNVTRNCSVSGDCGPSLHGNAVYVDEVAPGGQIITRFDATTGARLYSSAVMPGFLAQSTPLVSPSGSVVYYNRIQNNGAVDFMYAWLDTGSAFQFLWKEPSGYTPSGTFACRADDSVFMVGPLKTVQHRDAMTGALLAESDAISTMPSAPSQVHMAVDAAGNLFVSNGEFPTGAVWCMHPVGGPTARLVTLWSAAVPNVNQGGPALASDGTLIVCGVGTDIRAWQVPQCQPADLDCNGAVNGADLGLLIGHWGACPPGGPCVGDINGDGQVNGADLGLLIGAWGP